MGQNQFELKLVFCNFLDLENVCITSSGENIISAWHESVLVENQTAAYITGLTHRVRLPKTDKEIDKHPVLLLVHGRHGNEDVPWIFARNIPDHWLIVSPRAIEFEPESDDHETGYSWMEMPPTGWPEFGEFDGAVQAMSDFVLALPDVYNADPDRILALGFSQGAATLLSTAVQHPNLLHGIAALVGFIPDLDEATLESQPLAKLPVFMAAGERDERIPVEVAEASRKTILAAGADVDWTMYQTGHKLNGQGMRDLAAWLEKMIQQLEINGVG